MSHDNPYASPQAPIPVQLVEESSFGGQTGGLWRNAIIVGWSLVLLSIGLVIGGIAAADRTEMAPLLILGGILLFFVGALYGLLRSRIVTAQRIADPYIWLKGVHPAVLADLAPWPYNP